MNLMSGLRRLSSLGRSSIIGNRQSETGYWKQVLIPIMNGFHFDHSVDTKIGGSTFDSSGRRHHSAADLFSYAKASNIRVQVYASVERILLASSSPYSGSKQSAIGVVFCD